MVIAAAGLAGCQTSGYNKSAAAAVSLQAASAEVQSESRALETTIAVLNDLVEHPSGDLRTQFRAYRVALDRLTAAVKRTEATGDRMREKNAAYLRAWDAQLAAMSFEHIRQSSETRKAEVSAQLESIDTRYNDTHNAVQPLVAYLEDIRMALDADLTIAGLASVRSIVTNAGENAAKVQSALAKLSDELASSSGRMSSIMAQTAASQPPPEAGRP